MRVFTASLEGAWLIRPRRAPRPLGAIMATLAGGSETIVQRRGGSPEEEPRPERSSDAGKNEGSSTGCWPLRHLPGRGNGDRPKSRRPPCGLLVCVCV